MSNRTLGKYSSHLCWFSFVFRMRTSGHSRALGCCLGSAPASSQLPRRHPCPRSCPCRQLPCSTERPIPAVIAPHEQAANGQCSQQIGRAAIELRILPFTVKCEVALHLDALPSSSAIDALRQGVANEPCSLRRVHVVRWLVLSWVCLRFACVMEGGTLLALWSVAPRRLTCEF